MNPQSQPNQQIIAIIAAMAQNRVIGNNNTLPWHLPADLKHFKALTTSHPIIMGRKTFDSIGRPLPNRQNIVITRQTNWHAPGVDVANSIEDAISLCKDKQKIFIIGGAQIYQQAFRVANYMHLTIIEGKFSGDAYFPEYPQNQWMEIKRESHPADPKNKTPAHHFIDYQKA